MRNKGDMNEMRLPGLGLLNNDTAPTQSSADTSRDPARAFDAVMSRFSSQPAPSPARNTSADAATKQNDATRAPDKAQAAGDSHDTQANARPAERSKGHDGDDESPDQATAAITDATALMAAVAGSAQLGAQNPALAAMLNGAATHGGKGTKGDAADVLDALAGKVDKPTGRAGEIASDPHALIAGADELKALAAGAAQGKRAPVATKDTLRIDAPLARAVESDKGDFAERLMATARSGIETAVRASSAPSSETPSQAIAAAVAGTGNGTSTYSIAHAAVAAPVGTSAFASELSQRVVVFAGQKVQRADIAVTPPELGPIAVSIEVRGQEATLAFAASSHTTRAAIEDALPRLREMLSAQGLQLAGAHVGSEPRRDPYRPARNEETSATGATSREATGPISTASNAPIARRMNLIDIEV